MAKMITYRDRWEVEGSSQNTEWKGRVRKHEKEEGTRGMKLKWSSLESRKMETEK